MLPLNESLSRSFFLFCASTAIVRLSFCLAAEQAAVTAQHLLLAIPDQPPRPLSNVEGDHNNSFSSRESPLAPDLYSRKRGLISSFNPHRRHHHYSEGYSHSVGPIAVAAPNSAKYEVQTSKRDDSVTSPQQLMDEVRQQHIESLDRPPNLTLADRAQHALTIEPAALANIGEHDRLMALSPRSYGAASIRRGNETEGCEGEGFLLEFVHLQDLTTSYADGLLQLQNEMPPLMRRLSRLFPNSRFGLASFSDKPVGLFGYDSDYCAYIEAPLTSDLSILNRALQGMRVSGGRDWPENQFGAIIRILASSKMGWTPPDIVYHPSTGQRIIRILSVATDALPHFPPALAETLASLIPSRRPPQSFESLLSSKLLDTNENASCDSVEFPSQELLGKIIQEMEVTPVLFISPAWLEADGIRYAYPELRNMAMMLNKPNYNDPDNGLRDFYRDLLRSFRISNPIVESLDIGLADFVQKLERSLFDVAESICVPPTLPPLITLPPLGPPTISSLFDQTIPPSSEVSLTSSSHTAETSQSLTTTTAKAATLATTTARLTVTTSEKLATTNSAGNTVLTIASQGGTLPPKSEMTVLGPNASPSNTDSAFESRISPATGLPPVTSSTPDEHSFLPAAATAVLAVAGVGVAAAALRAQFVAAAEANDEPPQTPPNNHPDDNGPIHLSRDVVAEISMDDFV